MMSLSQLAYNLELWFWSVVINLFSSSSNRLKVPKTRLQIRYSIQVNRLRVVVCSFVGLAIGFTLGALFL